MFVPAKAWHAVINLDDTIAVTQNFMSRIDLEKGWGVIKEEKKHLIPLLIDKFRQKVF